MPTLISKKTFKYRNNAVGVKVTDIGEDDIDLKEVIVVCARGKKRYRGLLTCTAKGIAAAKKRLISGLLIQ